MEIGIRELFAGGGTGFGLYPLERNGNAVTVTVRGSNLASRHLE